MPTGSSNFTIPDTTNEDMGISNPHAVRGLGDNGEVWNPSGGPNGTGAWETPPATSERSQTFVPGAWGGRGNDMMTDGTLVEGTSGAARDVYRYQRMGQVPVHQTGAGIATHDSNEARGIQMGALGLLGQTMNGSVPSAAERLGTQQGIDAGRAQSSMGQSVRGGAMARAAAMRQGVQNSASIEAQQRQANAATRAGEMAGARGAYFGAASGMRDTDTAQATEQAKLDAQQRQINDQREGFYEDRAHGVKVLQAGAELERSGNENAAAVAGRQQDAASAAAAAAADRQLTNTVLTTAKGGIEAASKSGTGSDERMKTGMRDMTLSPGEAKQSIRPLDRMRSRSRSLVRDNPYGEDRESDIDRANPYDAPKPKDPNVYDGSMFKSNGEKEKTSKLHAGIEALLERDRPAGPITREDPYVERGITGAPKGYAATRFGQPGSIFQPPVAPRVGLDMPEANAPKNITREGDPSDRFSREIMGLPNQAMSDEKTKTSVKKLTPEEKKKQDDEDAAETARFIGSAKPAFDRNAQMTPEEAKEARDREAYEQREGEVTKRKMIKEAEDAKGIAFADKEDGQTAAHAERLKHVPLFGRWAQGKADELRSQPAADRAERGTRDRKAQEASLVSRAELDAKLRPYVPDAVLKWADNAPVQIGYRPDRDSRYKRRNPVSFERDTTLSPGEAKQEIRPIGYEGAIPLQDFDDSHQLRVDDGTGRGFYETVAPAPSLPSSEHASLAGPTPRFGKAGKAETAEGREASASTAPKKVSSPKSKPRKMSDAELMAYARQMMGSTEAQGEASRAEGPATRAALERSNDVSYSDEKTKKGADGASPMADANRAMHPYEYEYKDGFREREQQAPGEKNVGPMAQEMDKDPVARTALIKDPQTGLLAIDKSKGLKLVMGGLADLQAQVDDMKTKRRRA